MAVTDFMITKLPDADKINSYIGDDPVELNQWYPMYMESELRFERTSSFNSQYVSDSFEFKVRNQEFDAESNISTASLSWGEESIVISPTLKNVPFSGDTFTATVSSNTEWDVSSSSYIRVKVDGSVITEGELNQTIIIEVDPHTSEQDRVGYVDIQSKTRSLGASLEIRQAKFEPATIYFTPSIQAIGEDTGVFNAQVTSNRPWEALPPSESDGVLISPPSGGEGVTEVSLSYPANESFDANYRQAYVAADQGMTKASIRLNQEARTPFIRILDTNHNEVDQIDVLSDAGDLTFFVESNGPWVISPEEDWLTLDRDSGGEGITEVTATVTRQPWSWQRNSYIYLTHTPGGLETGVTIMQYGSDSELEISPTELTIGVNEHILTIDVESNDDWYVWMYEILPDWVTIIDPELPHVGVGDGIVKFRVSENESSERTVTITISTTGEAQKKEFQLTQVAAAGSPGEPNPIPDPIEGLYWTDLHYNEFGHACDMVENPLVPLCINEPGVSGLETATAIYEDHLGEVFAPMGYYSNGTISRQWDGAAFQETINCSEEE